MKKSVILLLVVCLFTSSAFTQNLVGGMNYNMNPGPINQKNMLVCDTVFSFPAVDNWSGGLASDGTYLYSITTNTTILVKYDQSGNPVDSFPLPTTTNLTAGDITFDGTNLWLVLEEDRMVFKVDPNNGNVLKSFTLPWGATFSEYYGCAYDNGYLWVSEYLQELLIRIDTISGALVDSFHINKWVLPLEIINGRLYGIDFSTNSPGGPMILTEFDKTNGSVLSTTPFCLPYTLGMATIGNTFWGLSSGSNFGTNRIYQFENLFLSDGSSGPDNASVTIFPNPVSDHLMINASTELNIEVLDLKGRIVLSENNLQRSSEIDVSQLSDGVYYLKLYNSEGFIYKKFVKH